MKYTLIFAIGLMLLFSCKKDPAVIPLEIQNLNSNHLKKYLPIKNFENKSVAVFVDSDGNEQQFDLNISFDTMEYKSNNILMKIENIQLSYSNPHDSIFSLGIVTMTQFNTSMVSFGSDYNPFGLIQIGPLFELGFDENGLANLYTEYSTTLIINDIEFEKVYSRITVNDNPKVIPETYYNQEIGIIGFVDKSSILWSFKEFKN